MFADGVSSTITGATRVGVTLPNGMQVKRDGFILDGWSKEPDGDIVCSPGGSYIMPTTPTTLYAHWKVGVVDITFRVEFTEAEEAGYVDANGYLTIPAIEGITWELVDVREPVSQQVTGRYIQGVMHVGAASGQVYKKTVNGKVIDYEPVSGQVAPFTVTANEFTGFRFIKWVDESNPAETACATKAFTAQMPKGGNQFIDVTYVAVIEELPAVTIKYEVEQMYGRTAATRDNPADTIRPVTQSPEGSIGRATDRKSVV